ncbi:hypothetical protein [Rhizorhabdus sp.]|uniref:hypothetical protein n=1 Tax=Rhizorhabdus sp. TaxID=1968843 RepID=UPI0019A72811|nr:hypothetical protein [Rhizorhabdus sp.]MBD3762584.1 hypothetical protein [Rhizorhabdus sp.]
MNQAVPRTNLLVSVGIAGSTSSRPDLALLGRLEAELNALFRYWELLIAVEVDHVDRYAPLLGKLSKVRLLKLRHGASLYRQRVALAEEAIGDVIVLSTFDEFAEVPIGQLIERAERSGHMVIARRPSRNPLSATLRGLGAGAGFRVDANDLSTAAYPRPILNRLLAHPDPQLALRFPPIDNSLAVESLDCGPSTRARQRTSLHDVQRRLSLAHKLLTGSASRVLTTLSLFASLVSISSLAYVFYAIAIWLFDEHVQPGWFTTSLSIGLTAFFLGCAIFGMSIGLQKIIDLLSSQSSDDIIEEITSIDLFNEVFEELNIEYDTMKGKQPITAIADDRTDDV